MLLFEKILRELENHKVQYMIAGGVAVNLHGVERATGDLDLLLSLKQSNIEQFVQIIKNLKWIPRVPVKIEDLANPKNRKQWIKEKEMKVFSVINPKDPAEHVDIMIEEHLDFEKAYRKRVQMPFLDFKVSVISVEDLIKLKQIANRDKDQNDVLSLKKILKSKHEKNQD